MIDVFRAIDIIDVFRAIDIFHLLNAGPAVVAPRTIDAMTDAELLSHALATVLPISTSRGSRVHGEQHWQRVAAHALYLAEQTAGADPLVAALFGVFHDSMRVNDGIDPGHGRRGGRLALQLNGSLGLDARRLDLLVEACADHTKGKTSTDPTIGACWDADRLDLVRLGFRLDARKISTDAGRSRDAIVGAVALVPAPPSWETIERLLADILERQASASL